MPSPTRSPEKRLLMAMGLCVLAFLAVEALIPTRPRPPVPPRPAPARPGEPKPAAAKPADGKPAEPKPGDGKPEGAKPADGKPAPAVPVATAGPDGGAPAAQVPAAEPEPPAIDDLRIESGRLVTVLRSRGASLGALRIRGILDHPAGDPAAEKDWIQLLRLGERGALGVTLESRDIPGLPDLETRNWRLVTERGAFPVVFEARVAQGFVVRKRFERASGPDDYHLRLTVTVVNENPDHVGKELRILVRGAGPLPTIEDLSRAAYFGWTKVRGVPSLKSHNGPEAAAGQAKKDPVHDDGEIEWAAAGSNFFAVILASEFAYEGGTSPVKEVRWEGARPSGADPGKTIPTASPLLVVPVGAGPQGEERSFSFLLFAGPKDKAILSREEYRRLDPVRDLGMFGFISEGLFLILSAFHAVVPNWGVSIVLLTLLVRAAMFPLSSRQTRSTMEYSRKMARIKPKLDALKERFKGDRGRQSQEQMKLMKEEGMPLMPGGCLLTFLQLPIWIALYGMLQQNFSLRHASFLWVHDLSAADHLWHMLPDVKDIAFVPNAMEWLNLLPLLMTATWFFASKATMTPPADDQQASMQRMMQWMPFVMLLFPGFYSMPAGLCLYITVSSSWGITESYIIRKRITAAHAAQAAPKA